MIGKRKVFAIFFWASVANVKLLPKGISEVFYPFNPKILSLSRVFAKGSTMVGVALTSLHTKFGSLKCPQKHAFLLGQVLKKSSPWSMCIKWRF